MPPRRKVAPRRKAAPKRKATPGRKRRPLTLVLYGPSGSGKTSLAAHFPRAGFICDSQEEGILYIQDTGLVPEPVWVDCDFDVESASSWPKLLERIEEASLDNTIETLVVESMTGIEQLCFLYHCREQFDNDWSREGFYNRWLGPKNAARFEWPRLIAALDLVAKKGKNVIFTAHAQAKEDPDPEGVSVMKWMVYSEKDTWARLHRWASGVFFVGQSLSESRVKKTLKRIADPNFSRILYTTGTPTMLAKNWFGIRGADAVINLGDSPQEGYENLRKVLRKCGYLT